MKEGIFFAKEFERNGVIFYLEKGMRAENIITKKLFYTLAKQEIEHLEAIENFIISGRYDTYRDNVKEVEFEIKKFFESLEEKDRLEKQLEVYSMALNMEKHGYSQYEKFYNEAVNEKEKKFFKFLMGEERKHIEALVNVYSYISETDDWFHKEESRVWNWMNL
ncbi:MAG: rubrerythrin [bacterium]|nr:rubrerythrin [bacterium]